MCEKTEQLEDYHSLADYADDFNADELAEVEYLITRKDKQGFLDWRGELLDEKYWVEKEQATKFDKEFLAEMLQEIQHTNPSLEVVVCEVLK